MSPTLDVQFLYRVTTGASGAQPPWKDTNGVLGGWDGAAARLGLSRTTLISRMQRLGITAGGGPGGAKSYIPLD